MSGSIKDEVLVFGRPFNGVSCLEDSIPVVGRLSGGWLLHCPVCPNNVELRIPAHCDKLPRFALCRSARDMPSLLRDRIIDANASGAFPELLEQ